MIKSILKNKKGLGIEMAIIFMLFVMCMSLLLVGSITTASNQSLLMSKSHTYKTSIDQAAEDLIRGVSPDEITGFKVVKTLDAGGASGVTEYQIYQDKSGVAGELLLTFRMNGLNTIVYWNYNYIN